MGNKAYIGKRVLLSVIALLLTLCLLFLIARIFETVDSVKRFVEGDGDEYAYQSNGRPEYLIDGKWYVQKESIETYLFIGIDKFEAAIRDKNGYRNSEQSDVMIVLSVDRKNKTYSMIHVNRDTMANVRMLDVKGVPYGTFEGQLALSHTYGSGKHDSCENTVWSVSDYLYGLLIDHYVSFTMDAVGVLNDKMGGVTLTVSDDMTVIDESLAEGATVTLKGNLALAYVRARGELVNSTNIERMKRQRQYVNAFLEQTKEAAASNSSLPTEMIRAVSDYVISDMDLQELSMLADVLDSYSFTGIRAIDGEAVKGDQYMEFYTDEDALRKLLIDTFYEEK